MPRTAPPDEKQSPGQIKAAKLINDFADFVKICTLYPSNNERVIRTTSEVLTQIHQLRDRRNRVRIRLMKKRFAVDHTATPCDKPNVEWLAECMSETALGGVSFMEDATEESLSEFAAVLRENVSSKRTAKRYEDLWTQEIDGLKMLERLFGLSNERWNMLSDATRCLLDEESPQGDVLREVLEGEDDILERLSRMFLEDPEFDGDEFVESVELVRTFVELMPDVLAEDMERSMGALDMLSKAEGDNLLQIRQTPSEVAHLEGRRRLLEVSSRMARKGSDGHKEDGKVENGELPSGHAGDSDLSEDLDTFAAEFEDLPNARAPVFAPRFLDARDEKLGIALHRLRNLGEHRDSSPALESALKQILEKVGGKAHDLLELYLTDLCLPREEGEPWAHFWGMAGLLDRTGLLQYMIDFHILTPGIVAATFAQTFRPFVSSLSDSEEDNERLAEVCRLMGPARILATVQDGWLTPEQRQRIYATPSPHVIPFALQWIEGDELKVRKEELDFLSSLKIDRPEWAALRFIDDVRVLPRDYVRDLCMLELKIGAHAPTLRNLSESLIRDYIQKPPPGVHTSRVVRAVGALRYFWSSKTEAFAKSLVRGTGPLRLKRPPKEIRDAVKTLLRTVAE